jgi:hydrogenase maturation protease
MEGLVGERNAQILIAGVGNAWMRDDGFGGEVIKELLKRELATGVTVEDFGTGGLDLAYEVMRGYDALILIDVTRGGEPPGTLYVLEPEESEIAAGIEDGEMIDPHSMDPQTVLRFVRAVSGWPGKVVVIACEPADIDEPGLGLSPEVEGAVARAVDVALETVAGLRDDVERASAR